MVLDYNYIQRVGDALDEYIYHHREQFFPELKGKTKKEKKALKQESLQKIISCGLATSLESARVFKSRYEEGAYEKALLGLVMDRKWKEWTNFEIGPEKYYLPVQLNKYEMEDFVWNIIKEYKARP